MTNEERIEERLIHAHERGYYSQVLKRVEKIKTEHPKMNRYDLYELACTESKEEWLKKTKNGL